MVMMNPFQPASVPAEKEGVILQVRRNTPEGPFRLKSHHFLNNLYGKRELGHGAAKEGIFLTEGGAVAEGIISNVFWRKGSCVYTPSLDTGILGGVHTPLRHRAPCRYGNRSHRGGIPLGRASLCGRSMDDQFRSGNRSIPENRQH